MKLRKGYAAIGILVLMACFTLALVGCDEVAYGRNSIAAANGAIASAQAEYLAECTADPSKAACRTINDAVKLHTTAVIGMETYCGFELDKPLPDPSAPCVPVKSAAAGLKVTVTNLQAIVGQINALVAAHKAKRASVTFPKCNHPDGHCWEGNTTLLTVVPYHIPDAPSTPLYGQLALDPQVIALALTGLKLLLDTLTSGKVADVADEAIQSVQGAIAQFSLHQNNEVTFAELESLKLKQLWPDTPAPTPAPTSTP